MADTLESQKDEIEALKAIYGYDFILNNKQSFDLRICCDEEKWWAVTISVLLPITYPRSDPPVFEIFTECLSSHELQVIYKELEAIWENKKGDTILYLWVEKIRDMLFEKYEQAKLFIESPEEDKIREKMLTNLMRDEEAEAKSVVDENQHCAVESDIVVPNIITGETITLKKSTFQGHTAIVHTVGEVEAVLRNLKERHPKVAHASHNIVAYRLTGLNETSFIQDFADDGEVNAGGRLLHLLQIMNVKNIVVVVSRWYGGILLGPDRFRLISNSARQVIVASGAYTPKQEKKRKIKSDKTLS